MHTNSQRNESIIHAGSLTVTTIQLEAPSPDDDVGMGNRYPFLPYLHIVINRLTGELCGTCYSQWSIDPLGDDSHLDSVIDIATTRRVVTTGIDERLANYVDRAGEKLQYPDPAID